MDVDGKEREEMVRNAMEKGRTPRMAGSMVWTWK